MEDDHAKDARSRAVEAALANARLEGMEPTPETTAILDRFVDGDIDGGEMIRLIGDRSSGSGGTRASIPPC